MSNNISLHPKYGLNPTMPICFICGKEKGEIALLGNHYKGKAPINMIIDLEPCADCKEKYFPKGSDNIIVLGTNNGHDPDLSMGFTIMKREAAEGIFQATIPGRFIFTNKTNIDKLNELYSELQKQ